MGILDAPAPSLTKIGRERLLLTNAAALQTWRAQLANRESSPATVCVLGDSIVEGQGATALSNRFVAKFRDRLRARYPVSGVTGGRGFISGDKTGVTTFTWPVTVAGTVTNDDQYGPKRRASILSASGQSRSFSLQGTSVDIMLAASTASGTLSYSIDGGAATTYNTGTISGNTSTIIGGKTLRVTLGASGAHTLQVAWSSGGSVYLEGVVEYDGDENAGIRVHDCGHFGWTTTNWASRTGFGYWMTSLKTLNPGLIVIELGTNDLSNSIPAATTLSNWQTIISTIRGTGLNPTFLIMPMFMRSDTTSAAWNAYVSAAYQLAASDSMIGIVDLAQRMPNVGLGSASLSLYADSVHPNNNGHSMMADLILATLSNA